MFLTFFKIGLFTFGGGYSMLPLLEREIVEKKRWATESDLMKFFTLGQCTPGIIAVNTATFIGCKQGGFIGGIVCTLGMVCPSVIVISAIAFFLPGFTNMNSVFHILKGIKIGVCVLLTVSLFKLGKENFKNKISFLIFSIAFFLAAFTKIPIAMLVISFGVFGTVLTYIKNIRRKTHE